MPIAHPRYFTADHFRACGLDAPASLSELAVHCLELVAELSQAGLRYQFKGGNSLLLILQKPQRFSIDVDIATDEPRERIEAVLDSVIAGHRVFTRWEKRQHKTKPWLPLASYYVYFTSVIDAGQETSVMLDAQLRRSPYATEMKPVRCLDVYAAQQTCELPLPSSIIGDKLLTLGPSTLGIPVGKSKEAQRLKHVFDVSTLLSTGPALSAVRQSFSACLRHELEIQERHIDESAVVADTLAFCATTLPYADLPEPDPSMVPVLQENVRGLAPFRDHLFSRDYSWQRLQRDMGRVALAVAALGARSVDDGDFGAVLTEVNRLSDDVQIPACWRAVARWVDRAEIPPQAVEYVNRI